MWLRQIISQVTNAVVTAEYDLDIILFDKSIMFATATNIQDKHTDITYT